jgi:hypothetical protein
VNEPFADKGKDDGVLEDRSVRQPASIHPAILEISMGCVMMNWILKRVPLIWLFLTAVIIGIVLHSIHTSGGFN